MSPPKTQHLPELFVPDDARWASRAAQRGDIRRLAWRLYTTNLDEDPERLLRRRWLDVAALHFPGAVIVDRSALLAGPADDGSLFLDSGPEPVRPRTIRLPGLILRPRAGPGPIDGDMPFGKLWMSSPGRAYLDNLRPSRARAGVSRTLRRDEVERRLDGLARVRGDAALNQVRDAARAIAPLLGDGAEVRFSQLDGLLGALQGTRDVPLVTRPARFRQAGLGYDTDRLALFETLRSALAGRDWPERPEPADPERLFAFFEAYFSNWIEGTIFEVEEAERIVFDRLVPAQRPADAHDVQGTFDAIADPSARGRVPADADGLESILRDLHVRVMAGRPEIQPGEYKLSPNRAGATTFVRPDLVRGTLREGFAVLATLPAGLPRAIFTMFLVSEVHPFADGNGRVARAAMNAELTAAGLCRVMIPLVYRDEYLNALRALSRNANPRPLLRAIDRVQRWSAAMPWTGHDRVLAAMDDTNALVDPDRADADGIHLLDPQDK